MTREQFAEKIGWSWWFGLAGLVNVGAMLPQLWQIITTQKVEGLSLTTFWIYFWVQVCFGLQGYFKRDRTLCICMFMSAAVSATIITSIYYLRWQQGGGH